MSVPEASSPDLALLHPVRAGNAFEETVERLLQMIRLGIVPPGERLPAERDLAVRLGVSRATLRDALGELHKVGWVEVRRGRSGGTFVCSEVEVDQDHQLEQAPLGGQEIEDVLAYRWVVEVGSAELAAGKDLAASTRRDLTAYLQAVDEASALDYRRVDSRFHLAIAEATGSAGLVRAVAEARTQVNALLDRIPLLETNLLHSNDQHRQIVQAVLAGDPKRARAAMIDHLEGSAALLRGFLA